MEHNKYPQLVFDIRKKNRENFSFLGAFSNGEKRLLAS
jgi:hypothetical protein